MDMSAAYGDVKKSNVDMLLDLQRWRSQPNSPVKYLQGSPTGSDRGSHLPSHPRHAPRSASPAFHVPNPLHQPHHPYLSPDQPEGTPSRGRVYDRSCSPYDSPEVRRVLAPSLIDRACSPMPDALAQQLPLPEILAAVRQQLLEPWAAHQLHQAHSQAHLQLLPEADVEAELEAAHEAVLGPSEPQAVRKQHLASQLPVAEQQAKSVTASPDARQLQGHDNAELGQIHSTADLEAASEVTAVSVFSVQQSLPSASLNDPSSPRLSPKNDQTAAADEEEELAVQEEELLHFPLEPAESASIAAEADSDASSSNADAVQQASWHEQWQQSQQQQKQKGSGPYTSQPNELMTKVAAAAVFEQSDPIRAVFERHSKPAALTQAETHACVAESTAVLGNRVDIRDMPPGFRHLQEVAELFEAEAASPAQGLAKQSWSAASSDHDEEDVHAVQDLPDELDLSAEHDLPAEHDRVSKHANSGSQHSRQAEGPRDMASVSKRSLIPATKAAANESSGETSPEAARNSRMKVRRTSGEYQQVLLPSAFFFAPFDNIIHIVKVVLYTESFVAI